MYTNNFDKSSTGINIELHLFYDVDRGQNLFDNNFVRLDKEKHFYYIDHGNVKVNNDSTLELSKINIIGYSQGDYATIYYNPKDLMDTWGCDSLDESQLKKDFTNYFFNTPIYAKFIINDIEYDIYDMDPVDEYDFKKDEFLKYVSDKSGVAVDVLEKLIPKHIDYN